VSLIQEGEYLGQPSRIVYAVFTTPENAIGGNAICAFQISDILQAFQGSIFLAFRGEISLASKSEFSQDFQLEWNHFNRFLK
jgi:hypothetical protein